MNYVQVSKLLAATTYGLLKHFCFHSIAKSFVQYVLTFQGTFSQFPTSFTWLSEADTGGTHE